MEKNNKRYQHSFWKPYTYFPSVEARNQMGSGGSDSLKITDSFTYHLIDVLTLFDLRSFILSQVRTRKYRLLSQDTFGDDKRANFILFIAIKTYAYFLLGTWHHVINIVLNCVLWHAVYICAFIPCHLQMVFHFCLQDLSAFSQSECLSPLASFT